MVSKPACSVSVCKNHYKGQRIRLGMAAEWVGKCNDCECWRTIHDTHKVATARDEDGKPSNFVLKCDFCSTPIQRKCCASGCPSCGGTGMHPKPQSYQPPCHLCGDPTTNRLGGRITCYGCEHEVMGYAHEDHARLMMLYGE